jgi:endonuclease I
MFKKLLLVLLFFITIGSLIGCNQASDPETEDPNKDPNQETPDTENPSFTLNDQTIEAGSADIDWTTQISGLTDDSDDTLTVTEEDDIDYDTPGVYQVTVTAVDGSGNSFSVSIDVTIIDSIAPSFDLVDQTIDVGSTDIDWTTQITSLTDNSDDTLTVTEVDGVDYDLPGTYQVTVTATDNSDNSYSKTITVTVLDTNDPNDDHYYDQYEDIINVHQMSDGTFVEVSGVVYFMTENGYYIQDDTYNLFIFTDQVPDVNLGERIVVNGNLATYREVKQITDPELVEVTGTDFSITQDVVEFDPYVTHLEPGHMYTLTGEVRLEGTYNTTYLYQDNEKIAEVYYRSLSHSIAAINQYAGEVITLDLLYYAEGDEVPRFAFQGSNTHIEVFVPDQSVALAYDADLLPLEKTLFDSFDFGEGHYGSTYEITQINGDIFDYVSVTGSYISVTRPSENDGDQSGTMTITISLGNEDPLTRVIDITIKAEGSSTVDMTYYQSTIGLTGEDLFYELHEIISKVTNSMSYEEAKVILEESDRDPNHPNNVILVYTRESVKGEWDYPNWNREHVWPQSKLNGAAKGDAHNLKPSDVQENSFRGNKPFGYGSSGVYEPHDDVKGDIARIVFYMVTMNTQLSINSGTIGNLDMFIEWHQMDPVDDFERNRNDVIYSYQGNRNPYIDYPEFVYEIFGDRSSTISSIYTDMNDVLFTNYQALLVDERSNIYLS